MNAVNKKHRIEVLESRHRELDKNIERGYSDYVDDTTLNKMKQEKLSIKDQIEKLKNEA